MAVVNFFSTPFRRIIEQEGLALFQQRLEEKTNYLLEAKNNYQKASDLILKALETISVIEDALLSVNLEIATCGNSHKAEKLTAKKVKYEEKIARNHDRLDPLKKRLEQLGVNIQTLQTEIEALNVQFSEYQPLGLIPSSF